MAERVLRIFIWPILGSLLSINFAFGKPVTTLQDAEEIAGMFEGDMILTADQERLLRDQLQGRNGLVDETKRWPNRIVYYQIVGDFGMFKGI